MTSYCGEVIKPNQTFCFFNDYSHFEYVVELYLITGLAIAGLLGNAISIVVMQRDKERRESLFLLQILAIADAFYLLVCLLRYPLKYIILSENEYASMQPVVFPLLKTAQTATIWTMLLVTFDRFIYICQPLKARLIFNHRGRRILAPLIFVMAFVYSIPLYIENCIMRFLDPCSGQLFYKMVYWQAFNNTIYFDIYKYAMYIVFLYLGPLSVLIVLNAKLVRAITYSTKHIRVNSGSRRAREKNATMVLAIIVVIFILCESPELVLKLVSLMNRHANFMNIYNPGLMRLHTVSELLMALNSSVNFLVYVAFGKRFRKIMKETFTPRNSQATLDTPDTRPLQPPHW